MNNSRKRARQQSARRRTKKLINSIDSYTLNTGDTSDSDIYTTDDECDKQSCFPQQQLPASSSQLHLCHDEGHDEDDGEDDGEDDDEDDDDEGHDESDNNVPHTGCGVDAHSESDSETEAIWQSIDRVDGLPFDGYDTEESEGFSSDEQDDRTTLFKNDLAHWAVECNIPLISITKLLGMLRKHNFEVPAKATTLLGTPRHTEVRNLSGSCTDKLFPCFSVVVFFVASHNQISLSITSQNIIIPYLR